MEEVFRMKKVFVYGTAVLALSAAPLIAQQPSGGSTTRQGSSATQPGSQSGTRSGDQAGSTRAASPAGSSQLASSDRQFIMEAARGGMAEVELGQLASDKAESPAVKQFAQRMVTDHGKANDELKSLAQSKNIMLPTDLDAKHKATKDRLSKLSGAQFDRAYMQDMVSDHQKDVSEFKKQSTSAKDPELKAWAAKTLPTLQEHLQMAQAASRSAVGTSGTRPEGGTRTAPGTPSTPGTGGTSPRGGSSGTPGTPGGGATGGPSSGSGPASGPGSTDTPR
jgi:putative membrane protein